MVLLSLRTFQVPCVLEDSHPRAGHELAERPPVTAPGAGIGAAVVWKVDWRGGPRIGSTGLVWVFLASYFAVPRLRVEASLRSW